MQEKLRNIAIKYLIEKKFLYNAITERIFFASSGSIPFRLREEDRSIPTLKILLLFRHSEDPCWLSSGDSHVCVQRNARIMLIRCSEAKHYYTT